MHYEVHGEGEPVILIMGITAPGTVWEAHVEARNDGGRLRSPHRSSWP